MQSLELEPIRDTPEDYDRLERIIVDYFREEIYGPLVALIPHSSRLVQNSLEDALEAAILSGKVRFYRGRFSGKFNSTLSRSIKALGATWDRKQGSWKISQSKLPVRLKATIALSDTRFNQTIRNISKRLSDGFDTELKMDDFFDRSLWKLDKKLQGTVRGITVMPKITEAERKNIARDYSNNLELYIKDFKDKEILELRQKIEKHVLSGGRYEDVMKDLQSSYGVSMRKAKFLARQETSLLMSTYKKERYASAGINDYKWRAVVGSPAHPTRPSHKALSDRSARGEIFHFDDPPYIDAQEGNQNPGCPFGCRCVAVPVVRFGKSQ